MNKAQISLEFLVILVAMIAILIVFLPVFSKLEKSVLLTLDVYNASKYLNEFKADVSMLNTLETGSSFVFNIKFIYSAKFSCEENILKFVLGNDVKSKVLSTELAMNCDFSYDIKKNANFLVTKESSNDLNIFVLSN